MRFACPASPFPCPLFGKTTTALRPMQPAKLSRPMKLKNQPPRLSWPGLAMGTGIGTAVSVSSGWSVGFGIGVAVALGFGFMGRRAD